MRYLLDANVFIQAKNLAYGFDICPGFWDWIRASHEADLVYSIDKVGDELAAGEDELAEWASSMGSEFFLPIDAATIPKLSAVSEWVQAQPRYAAAATNQFFSGADYYLIAFALAHGDQVVTHEVHAPLAKKRVAIPTVCIGVQANFTTPWQMLRKEGARFVLETAGAARGTR